MCVYNDLYFHISQSIEYDNTASMSTPFSPYNSGSVEGQDPKSDK